MKNKYQAFPSFPTKQNHANLKALYSGLNQQTKEQGPKTASRTMERPNVDPEELLMSLLMEEIR